MDNKDRKNQVRAFLVTGFFLVLSVGALLVNELYIYLVAYIWFGFIYGMCLQYGRFCFSSAFRDLFAVGVPRMAVGIMIATVLFGITAAAVTVGGMSAFHAGPFGVHSIIAGVVFGVGMVFAGGCASSSLYKTGEGNMVSAIVMVSISVMQAAFVDVGGWMNKLVPAAWHQRALQRNLPASIDVGDGWVDQYLAGYAWDRPFARTADVLGMTSDSVKGAFFGNFFMGALLPAAVLLFVVYFFYNRKGFLKKYKRQNKVEKTGIGADLAGYWAMVTDSKRTAVAGLILGVAAGLHMFVMKGLRMKFGIDNAAAILTATGNTFGISARGTVYDPGYWYVTTQEAQWFGWLFNKLGWSNMDNIFFGWIEGIPNPIFNLAGWMSISLIGGAAVMASLSGEFKFKKPSLELAIWAILGGSLMGIGARLGLGCNIGAFFVRVANGDLSGWMFGIGMTGGAWVGVRFFKWWTERKMAKEAAVATDLQL